MTANATPNAATAAHSLPLTIGRTCAAPSNTSATAAASAMADPVTTARREPDSAASSGAITNQIAANELNPPVQAATSAAKPVSATAETTCALSKLPVRDK